MKYAQAFLVVCGGFLMLAMSAVLFALANNLHGYVP